MLKWREQVVEGLKVGDTFKDSRTFTMDDMIAFGKLTGDYNPVHYDARFCELKGFDGLILHGLLVLSILTRMGGQLAWLLGGLNFRMFKPVYPGDTVSCTITITEIDERNRAKAEAVLHNQHGGKVMECSFQGVLPNRRERERMAQMMAEGDPTNGLK
jgi:3-hydroxybutyryl-CoA dehydratase